MTAVEWLKSKIIEDIRMDDLISGSYSKEQYKLFLLDKIEYALELEKEQKKQIVLNLLYHDLGHDDTARWIAERLEVGEIDVNDL